MTVKAKVEGRVEGNNFSKEVKKLKLDGRLYFSLASAVRKPHLKYDNTAKGLPECQSNALVGLQASTLVTQESSKVTGQRTSQ